MILGFWHEVTRLAGGALALDGRVLLTVRDDPSAYPAAVVLAAAAGLSLALGQSVVLFANRVPSDRFAAVLCAGALLYLARLLLWATSIWLVGLASPRHALPLDTTFLAVCAGQAPQLFGFFVLLPYVGMSIRRLLDAYSLVVVLTGMRVMLGVPPLAALFVTGLGWLLQAFLAGLLERPLAGVRGWMWRTASGREAFEPAAEIVDELLRGPPAPAAGVGDQVAPPGYGDQVSRPGERAR